MIERLCKTCDKPVKGKLFDGDCRKCYDKKRVATMVAIPKKLEPVFKEYAGERSDTSKCIVELIELGLKTWKEGKRVIIVPQ
jgi:hypothetical protein